MEPFKIGTSHPDSGDTSEEPPRSIGISACLMLLLVAGGKAQMRTTSLDKKICKLTQKKLDRNVNHQRFLVFFSISTNVVGGLQSLLFLGSFRWFWPTRKASGKTEMPQNLMPFGAFRWFVGKTHWGSRDLPAVFFWVSENQFSFGMLDNTSVFFAQQIAKLPHGELLESKSWKHLISRYTSPCWEETFFN